MAKSVTDIALIAPVSSLISYHYFHDIDVDEMTSWGLRMVGDSGAFSAMSQGVEIDRDHFYSWALRWRNSLLWTASLDVIGNERQSLENWRLAPEGLIPTIHYGASEETLKPYVDAGCDLIGLGGMVPLKSEPKRLLRWTARIMKHARDHFPHVRFHGWGITHPELVMNLPWWSVDSSGYASAFRFGHISLFDPRTSKRISVNMNGRAMAVHRDLLRTYYGIDWTRVAESTAITRRDVARLAMRSQQLLEEYLQKRWHITPPQSLNLSDGTVGPLVHLVLGAPSMQPAKSLSPYDKEPPRHRSMI